VYSALSKRAFRKPLPAGHSIEVSDDRCLWGLLDMAFKFVAAREARRLFSRSEYQEEEQSMREIAQEFGTQNSNAPKNSHDLDS
jgi:hypothetical protein